MHRRAMITTAAAATLLATGAQAVVLDESWSAYRYAFDRDTLHLAPGEAGAVSLYLVEVTGGVAGPYSLAYDEGLVSAAAKVVADPQSQGMVDLTAVNFTDVLFLDRTGAASGSQATMHLALDTPGDPGVLPGLTGVERWVKLADLTFQAGQIQGDVQFTALDPDGLVAETVTYWNSVLDLDIAQDVLTVSVHTPEPASLALMGIGLAMVTGRAARRRGV